MRVGACLMLLASGLGIVCLASERDHWSVREQETIHKTLSLSGEPMRLVVDNVFGYVHVTGWSGATVEVTAHKTIRADTNADLQQAKSEVKLNIAESPGSVSVEYAAPWRCNDNCRGCCSDHRRFYEVVYDLDIRVPRAARAIVSTVNEGDVEIEQTEGDFNIGNVNGAIALSAVSGSGDVHTVNGRVTVRFSHNPSRPSSFKSVNGPLDVYFPQALSADLSFKTLNGEIYSDFDVTARAVSATQGERREGKFVYRSNRMSAARAGQGGPELSFDTLNGNIRLHRQ